MEFLNGQALCADACLSVTLADTLGVGPEVEDLCHVFASEREF